MPTPTHFSSWRRRALPAALLVLAQASCGGEAREPAQALAAAFPAHAPAVLRAGQGFAREADRFVTPAGAALRAELPADGSRAIVLRGEHGFEARVVEVGARGAATVAERAVSYRREGGATFWTAGDDGVEEWLLLDAAVVHRGEVLAAWDVTGAAMRRVDDLVELDDAQGVPRLRVTAPAAYAAGGRPVAAHLDVRGARLELSVDADGEAVLVDPSWTPTSLMTTGRIHFATALLPDGSVLAVGGRGTGNTFLASAERYNVLTNTWSSAGSMSAGREWLRATLLPTTGKVLVTGGQNATVSLANADLYDPGTNTWAPTTAMPTVRATHTQTVLGDGRALVANGNTATADVYDPAGATWTATGPMSVSRAWAGATLLNNGGVLVAGGNGLASAEIYDPVANSWTGASTMTQTRVFHRLVTLPSGKVLVAGGMVTNGGATLSSVEIFDPTSTTWSAGPPMSVARQELGATLLTTGVVLVTGGGPSSTEMYDPATNTWSAGVAMNAARSSHGATLLTDGRVLVCSGGLFLKSAEFYSTGLGAPCVTNVQCPSGFCADGVCCNAACTGLCNSCLAQVNPAFSAGQCHLAAQGTDVRGDCSDQGAASCGTDGSCDGAGACEIYASGTLCVGPVCQGNTFVGQSVCNSVSSCVPPAGKLCDPGLCTTLGCGLGCVTDTDCAASGWCSAGTCVVKQPTGQPATGPNQCVSGFAADGFCCNNACAGACAACSALKKGGGADGACGPIQAGADPDNECPNAGPASCGTSGACDGGGACAVYAAGTVCAPASCAGSTLIQANLCDGSGSCVVTGNVSCAPTLCAGGTCPTGCAVDTDCIPGAFCSAGTCAPQKPLGQPATGPNECASGFAADGVCCNNGCGGPCSACTAAKKGSGADGTCGPIQAGADPDHECTAQGPASCASSGACDGLGACALYPAGTVCVAASCQGATLIQARLCDGKGVCLTSGSVGCAPAVCAGGTCQSTCAADTDCVSTGYCNGGTCASKKPLGVIATGPGECLSGSVADGVCCDKVCLGTCVACLAAKNGVADGTCAAVTAGTDPDGECPAGSAASCGNSGGCGGPGTCALHPAGTVCVSASCQGSQLTEARLCDGGGTCAAAAQVDCGLALCTGGVCASSCTVDADCAGTSAYCDLSGGEGGTCAAKKPIGQPAGAGNECLSSFAADGVCCDKACQGGPCDACAVAAGAGADGKCTPIDAVACDDGDACTLVDVCKGGVCQGGSPKDCPAPDACHVPGACDAESGACSLIPAANGAPCDDGNPCTSDACSGGVCAGLNLLDGTACLGGECFAGACVLDPLGGTGPSGASVGATSSGVGSSSSGDATGSGAGGGGGGAGGAGTAPRFSGGACVSVSGAGAPAGGEAPVALLLAWVAARRRRSRAATTRR